MSLSSLAQSLRLRYGIRWAGKYPPISYRFLFRAVMVAAVAVMVMTNQDLSERAAVMEQVLQIYEPIVQTMHKCEAGAVGYAYSDGRTFECSKPL